MDFFVLPVIITNLSTTCEIESIIVNIGDHPVKKLASNYSRKIDFGQSMEVFLIQLIIRKDERC